MPAQSRSNAPQKADQTGKPVKPILITPLSSLREASSVKPGFGSLEAFQKLQREIGNQSALQLLRDPNLFNGLPQDANNTKGRMGEAGVESKTLLSREPLPRETPTPKTLWAQYTIPRNSSLPRVSPGTIQMDIEIRDTSKLYKLKDTQELMKLINLVFKDIGEFKQFGALLNYMLSPGQTFSFKSLQELVNAIKAQEKLNDPKLQDPTQLLQYIKEELKKKPDFYKQKNNTFLSLAAAFKLSQKYQIAFFVRPEQVLQWGGSNLITQTLQQRGDMTHVLPALELGKLRVAVCFENSTTMLPDAVQILEYYLPKKDQVCIYPGSINDIKAPHSLTYATQVLSDSAKRDPFHTRQVIKEMTTGGITKEDRVLYGQWCQDMGFEKGLKNKYIIVSHRDTGHNVPEGRQPSHPELDTGEDGFLQLMKLVASNGYIPVPMGEPKKVSSSIKPNLIAYWLQAGKYKFQNRSKRQIEYGLIRFLAEEYGVRLLAMRSGNTDAMAFAGMETLFLDLASEGATQQELNQAKLKVEAHNRSWRRAAMLESVLPGIFHQGFFMHPRTEEAEQQEEKKETKKKEKAKEKKPTGPWSGEFDPKDLKIIDLTLKQFFGEAREDIGFITERAKISPIRKENRETFTKKLRERNQDIAPEKNRGRFETFAEFAEELESGRTQMLQTPMFVLNQVDIELDRIGTRLMAIEADLKRIEQDLERLRKEMDQFYETWSKKFGQF